MMKTRNTTIFMTLVALAAVMLLSLSSHAATLEVLDVDITSPYEDDVAYQIDGNEVTIEMDVWYEEGAEPIFKEFSTNGKSGIIHLTEIIHVQGDIPLTDWHEQLYMKKCDEWVVSSDNDGLWWGNSTSSHDGNDGDFPVVEPEAEVVINEDQDMVNVFFVNPVEGGFDIRIEKDILVPYECRAYQFAIAEWPTADPPIPEPSMAIVLLTGLLTRRLRRK